MAQQPAGSSNNRISSRDRANSRIGSVISPGRTPPPNAAQQPAAGLNNRTSSSRNTTIGNYIGRQRSTTRTRKQTPSETNSREYSRIGGETNNRTSIPTTDGSDRRREFISGSRIINDTTSGRTVRKAEPQRQTTIINGTRTNIGDRPRNTRPHRFETASRQRLIYRDRPYHRQNYYSFDHTYVDRLHRIRHKTIWPRYNFVIRYNRGPRFSYWHFYPYYHRKYVFVSLGGYWPLHYRYIRYYWYGCHLYDWYGYYPIAREIQGDTYNYYTYNYYYDDGTQTYNTGQTYNNTEYSAEEPTQSTLADTYFEEAVQAFENGNYEKAMNKFAQALELAPDDLVLPFAYCQAMLAAERYSEAAEVLRTVLVKLGPENEGVFFPRGLYPNEEILLSQLDKLAEKAEMYSFDADLQFLLGYQLLGIGQLEKAEIALAKAGLDLKNAKASAILLRLLEKIKTTDGRNQEAQTEKLQSKNIKTNQFPVQNNITGTKHASTIKGTVLVATLCVLAGSTGIGHYFRIC
ncbi:MAG: tetratricopeptide repeat protein [Sedimentisphaerales bacterium]|nr:tetratricopeptide repeat protein [Sedimentisphaerales bacterium]